MVFGSRGGLAVRSKLSYGNEISTVDELVSSLPMVKTNRGFEFRRFWCN